MLASGGLFGLLVTRFVETWGGPATTKQAANPPHKSSY
jgi:hypothetical protein